ncbi:MAG: 3-hydroxyacyl-[acyl-carrier protein] dehydratase/trans-2-decenoyl-[acyl-carrier protein] isomerase [Oceanicoccus sp.]|jgi:3-hydroxyacyl-[acyl-carrier protein] dehydratase/trans-2-decenoyl-[acyl-carrier protein] isomerase
MSLSPTPPDPAATTLDVIENMPVQALLDHFAAQGIEIKLPIDELGIIQHIRHLDVNGGANGKGEVITEMAIDENAWFFRCHFPGDPIMPGCLGIEGMWQSIGAILAAKGHHGKLRALGIGGVKFFGEVRPTAKVVTFKISIDRSLKNKQMIIAVASGSVEVDGEEIYRAEKLKVGVLFDD